MFGPAEEEKSQSVSDALEQVGVAVGSSAAVTQLPDARAELHGTAVTHPTLRGGGGGGWRGYTHTVKCFAIRLYIHQKLQWWWNVWSTGLSLD